MLGNKPTTKNSINGEVEETTMDVICRENEVQRAPSCHEGTRSRHGQRIDTYEDLRVNAFELEDEVEHNEEEDSQGLLSRQNIPSAPNDIHHKRVGQHETQVAGGAATKSMSIEEEERVFTPPLSHLKVKTRILGLEHHITITLC